MKRISNLFYLLGQGVKSVFKNTVMSMASMLTLIACLLVLGSFYLIIDNISENAKLIEKLNQVVATLDDDLTQEQIDSITSEIGKMDNVLSWNYKSKEQALEELKDSEYGEYIAPNIDFDKNPLSNTVEVTFENVDGASALVYRLESLDGVTEVSSRLDTVLNIERVKNGLVLVAVIMMAILLLVSLFVIMNTIKLTIFARREEIDIMRYVGSTGFFITMPFITEGAIIGLLSAAIAFGLQYYIYTYVFVDIVSSYSIAMKPFWDYAALIGVAYAAVGLVTGVLASGLSVRRYSSER